MTNKSALPYLTSFTPTMRATVQKKSGSVPKLIFDAKSHHWVLRLPLTNLPLWNGKSGFKPVFMLT